MPDTTPGQFGHLLIGQDRLFYSGLIGNSMRIRRLGGFAIYVSPDDGFEVSVNGGPWQRREIVALMPFTEHRLRGDSNRMFDVMIESESVAAEDLAALFDRANSAGSSAELARHVRHAHHELVQSRDAGGFSARQFDEYFLHQPLRPRSIDSRIARVLGSDPADPEVETPLASDLAADLGLSTSRFLHLFKANTGLPFRSHRMWKRARRFLDHAAAASSLTDVALDLGYPDSSHFSHSIRQTYGLQPRSIRRGSQGLRVFTGDGYSLSA